MKNIYIILVLAILALVWFLVYDNIYMSENTNINISKNDIINSSGNQIIDENKSDNISDIKNTESQIEPTNIYSDDKMLLILSAPSVDDKYYQPAFQKIIDFQINYAKNIIWNDNVIVIADKKTMPYFVWKLPDDILLEDDLYDIWMRDFTTVNPLEPVQFQYTRASMTQKQSQQVQNQFDKFADKYNLKRIKTDLILDGGNIVDNYIDKAITTTRFMEDNNFSYDEAKEKLKEILGVKQVAILEPDDEVLAHSDWMVSWLDDNTLAVNNYEDIDPEFDKLVMDELIKSFPDTKIIKVPVEFKKNKPWEREWFESACWVNLNAVMTKNNIYIPTFDMNHEIDSLKAINDNTNKNIIQIDAQWVCAMWWSVRCMTRQVHWDNAKKLIKAAQSDK